MSIRQEKIQQLKNALFVEEKRNKIAQLKECMQDETLWSDWEKGQKVSQELSALEKYIEDYEMLELMSTDMSINDEDFEKEIGKVWEKIKIFKPEVYGYEWADEEAPRIQLEPLGYRGYIEARPVRAIRK